MDTIRNNDLYHSVLRSPILHTSGLPAFQRIILSGVSNIQGLPGDIRKKDRMMLIVNEVNDANGVDVIIGGSTDLLSIRAVPVEQTDNICYPDRARCPVK